MAAHQVCFELLQRPPLFDFEMRLGEGTGAVIGMNLLEAAAKIYLQIATSLEAGVSKKSAKE